MLIRKHRVNMRWLSKLYFSVWVRRCNGGRGELAAASCLINKMSNKMKLTPKDLSVEPAAVELLRAVRSGVQVFIPNDSSQESLADFQATVKLLRMLEGRRLITEICGLNLYSGELSSVNDQAQGKIDRVRISGGLTPKGCEVLAYHDHQAGDVAKLT